MSFRRKVGSEWKRRRQQTESSSFRFAHPISSRRWQEANRKGKHKQEILTSDSLYPSNVPQEVKLGRVRDRRKGNEKSERRILER
jgi:hypothetical protein